MLAPDWSAWLPGRLQGLSAAPSAGTCPDIPDLALTLHPDLALTLQTESCAAGAIDLQHTLKGVQGGGHFVLQENLWNRSLDRYFQELIS